MTTELSALIIAETAAWEAFNAANLSYVDAQRAYEASWRERWGGTDEAHANLLSARKAREEASKLLAAARVARFSAAVSIDASVKL